MVKTLLFLFCLSGLTSGGLEVCSDHPYYFCDGEDHVVLVGVSDRGLFHIWENAKGFSWRKYLDDISRYHLNYVRHDVCSWGGLLTVQKYPGQLSGAAWAFLRTGPGLAVDGKAKFDLRRFDQSYFDSRIKPFIREAGRRGIYVELTLFEEFRKSRDFGESLFSESNNVNGLGLGPRQITSDATLKNAAFIAIQHAFVDKVLAETAEFGNVIYEISNESGGRAWVAHMIDYIHTHPKHPSRLVSAGEQTSSFDPRIGDNDIVIKHRGGGGLYASDADVWNHHRAMLAFRVGRPVIHNEYFLYANRSTDDVNFVRKMMWGDLTAGGHSNFFDFAFWRGSGRTVSDGERSRTPASEILEGGKYLIDFVNDNNVGFWEMSPHDELALVDKAGGCYVMTFAKPGFEYVCYVLGKGPVTVSLQLVGEGGFAARWYNPKTGRFIGEPRGVDASGLQEFDSPSFEQDIVLYVSRP